MNASKVSPNCQYDNSYLVIKVSIRSVSNTRGVMLISTSASGRSHLSYSPVIKGYGSKGLSMKTPTL